MSIKGFENLITTYNKTDNHNIIQVINMYKSLLESNDKIDYFKLSDDIIFENIITIYDSNLILLIHNLLLIISEEDNYNHVNNYIQGLDLIMLKNKLVVILKTYKTNISHNAKTSALPFINVADIINIIYLIIITIAILAA